MTQPKERKDVVLEKFHFNFFTALRIEVQLNVYLLNSYQTDI